MKPNIKINIKTLHVTFPSHQLPIGLIAGMALKGFAEGMSNTAANTETPEIGEKWPGLDAIYAGTALSSDETTLVHLILWEDDPKRSMEGNAALPLEIATKQASTAVVKESLTAQAATTAADLLQRAAGHMADRATTYDKPTGERSMDRAVTAFNAITGHALSEADGWLFMQVLKDARQWQRTSYHADSAEDCIAYAALKAEALANSSAA